MQSGLQFSVKSVSIDEMFITWPKVSAHKKSYHSISEDRILVENKENQISLISTFCDLLNWMMQRMIMLCGVKNVHVFVFKHERVSLCKRSANDPNTAATRANGKKAIVVVYLYNNSTLKAWLIPYQIDRWTWIS